VAANEKTAFRPKSPYGVAKAAAHMQVVNYRESYGLFACNGILFNHESPLRPTRFVTRKVIAAISAISGGARDKLKLGNTTIFRDWGWAPEYVEAMWLMLQQPVPDDFVIATGESHSLDEFIRKAFEFVDLDYLDFVEQDERMLRPSEILYSYADPSKAARVLNWSAKNKMSDVVRLLMEAEMAMSQRPKLARDFVLAAANAL
jgi:GDPmannose 4,6-dehydratase